LGLVNKASLFNNFAVLYRRQKRFDKAIEYLDKARKENPNFPNIDGTLALIYADKGEEENFYKYLLVALEKGCPIWKYLNDTGFNKYREQEKLKLLIESYKKKYVA
jgi:tetratricopeptide (TPR) repeat protein